MAIQYIKKLSVGVSAAPVAQLLIETNNTVAEVLATGYLTTNAPDSGVQFSDKQLASVYTTDGKMGVYGVSVVDGIASLTANPEGIVTLPVVSGNLPKFSGTTGLMVDSGASLSNAAKTKVMMANAAMVVDNFVTAADTAGTGKDSLKSASNAAKTKVVMADAATTIGKVPVFTDIAGTIGDGPVAGANVLTSAIATPDVSINLVRFDVDVNAAALAAGASITLYASSGAKQYKVISLWINSPGTNFSGGGGDRDLSITDNTTVYSVIADTDLQAHDNSIWGTVAFPFPAAAGVNQSTAAGASLVAKYSGGTTDYTAGSFVISGILQRVA